MTDVLEKTPGSEAPTEGRCGGKLAGSAAKYGHARYCLRYPKRGRSRCYRCGGNARRGVEHPRYAGKGYSKVLPLQLADKYDAMLNDASVMDMCDLTFDDHSFDSVYAVRAVKNLLSREDQRRAITEIARITARRVILFDTFVGVEGGAVPTYNFPLDLDHCCEAFSDEGFRLSERIFFPDDLRYWKTCTEQLSEEGCLIFDRE